jgi:E3 ubiquitin-protein ligase RAD18
MIVLQDNLRIECPICSKFVPMPRINDHLDSGCKSYLSDKTASSSKSEQKDAWSKLLHGKKSGKEK